MVELERLYGLLACNSESAWSNHLSALARDQGFSQTLFGIVANKRTPLETAFVRSNYVEEWRRTYEVEKPHYVDPIVRHCSSSCLPLVWDPDNFRTDVTHKLYEEAQKHGIHQGITYPIHGANGQFGVINFVSDEKDSPTFRRELPVKLSQMALIRDFIAESCTKFTPPSTEPKIDETLTAREIQCLYWAADGKSSWEISRILSCTEATVNFHFANVRRKFGVSTRQQAIVKAIRYGIIDL